AVLADAIELGEAAARVGPLSLRADRAGVERHAETCARVGGGLGPAGAGRAREQREAPGEEIERRASLARALEPEVGRPVPRPGARYVVDHLVRAGLALAAVGHHRRRLVVEAELHPEEAPVPAGGRRPGPGGRAVPAP